MPRSKQEKLQSRERIRASAAAELRRQGVRGLSLHRAMRDAGLTVGGFYGHYRSRDDLVLDAFLAAASQRREFVRRALEGVAGRERLTAFAEAYLAEDHVANVEGGCPWAAVLSELPRLEPGTRTTISEVFAASAGSLSADREAAIATLALSFASLILMRATTDDAQREEIARAARRAVAAIAESSGTGGAL